MISGAAEDSRRDQAIPVPLTHLHFLHLPGAVPATGPTMAASPAWILPWDAAHMGLSQLPPLSPAELHPQAQAVKATQESYSKAEATTFLLPSETTSSCGCKCLQTIFPFPGSPPTPTRNPPCASVAPLLHAATGAYTSAFAPHPTPDRGCSAPGLTGSACHFLPPCRGSACISPKPWLSISFSHSQAPHLLSPCLRSSERLREHPSETPQSQIKLPHSSHLCPHLTNLPAGQQPGHFRSVEKSYVISMHYCRVCHLPRRCQN